MVHLHVHARPLAQELLEVVAVVPGDQGLARRSGCRGNPRAAGARSAVRPGIRARRRLTSKARSFGAVNTCAPPGLSTRWISARPVPGWNTCSSTSWVMNRSIDSSGKVSASMSSLRTPSRYSPRGTSGEELGDELVPGAQPSRKSLDGEDSWTARCRQPGKCHPARSGDAAGAGRIRTGCRRSSRGARRRGRRRPYGSGSTRSIPRSARPARELAAHRSWAAQKRSSPPRSVRWRAARLPRQGIAGRSAWWRRSSPSGRLATPTLRLHAVELSLSVGARSPVAGPGVTGVAAWR